MLAYGGYGAGKTVLAATSVDVPSMRDVLLISPEGGEMSILEDKERIKNGELIDVVGMSSFKQVSYIKDFLTAHCVFRDRGEEDKLQALQSKLFPGSEDRLRKYRTVIIDSLSELEALNMYELLQITDSVMASADMPVAEFKEYKQNHSKIQLLIRAFKNLPMNVLVICSSQYEQDETKRYHFTPNMTGKLASQIQGFFDIVGFLTTGSATEDKEAPRRFWIQPVGGKFDAKNRRASLKKAFLDDPTMSVIMKDVGLAK